VSKAFEKKPCGKYVEYTTRHLDTELLTRLKVVAIVHHWTVEHALNLALAHGIKHLEAWEEDAN